MTSYTPQAHLASIYLKWISIGLPAYAFNAISRQVLLRYRETSVIVNPSQRRYFQSQGEIIYEDD
jgi:hypothetical protein